MANEVGGLRREKFMGMAEEVRRPALPPPAPLPAAAPATPAPTARESSTNRAPTPANLGRIERAGQAVGGLARRVAPLARGVAATAPLTGFGDYKVGNDLSDVDSSAAGTIGYAMAGEGGKMVDSLRKGAVETGLDMASGFAKTVDGIGGAFGANPGLSGKLSSMVSRDLGPGTTVPTPAVAQSPVLAAPQAPGAAIAGPAAPTTVQPEKLAGTPLDGFAGVRKVIGPNGQPLYTNATSNAADAAFMAGKGGGLGSSSFDPAAAQRSSDLAQEISLMQAGLRDRGDKNAYLKGAIGVASLSPGGASSELQEQIAKITRGGKNLTAAGAANVNGLITADMNNQRQRQELGERSRAAELSAQVQREAQGVTVRGQDIGERNAAATLRQRQAQDDREFGLKGNELSLKRDELGLKREELGVKSSNEALAQRQTFDKNLTERYSTQFRTPDGKVDDARVAKFKTGIQTFVGNKQAELAAKIQAGKATPEEAQLAAKLAKMGAAALDEEDLTNIETNIKRGERAKETATMMPWGGTYIESNNPNDYAVRPGEAGVEKNKITSDYVVLQNGTKVLRNDLEFNEPGNRFLSDRFKTRTNQYGVRKDIK